MKATIVVKLNEPLRELQTSTQVLIKVLSVIGRGVINP